MDKDNSMSEQAFQYRSEMLSRIRNEHRLNQAKARSAKSRSRILKAKISLARKANKK